MQSSVESHGVTGSCVRTVSCHVRRLRQLCVFISSSLKICSLLDDLPTELRWYAVLAQVSEDDGDNDTENDSSDQTENSMTAKTALQSLNHLMSSSKDDVQRRIRGVMSRTVDSLSDCVCRKAAAVTDPSCIPTAWHDVSLSIFSVLMLMVIVYIIFYSILICQVLHWLF